MATLARFFSSEIGFELVRGVRVHAEREVTLELDYAALKARADIPDLFAAIEMAPVEALPCLRAAVHEVVFNSPVGRKELPGLQVHPAAAKVARPPRVDIHLVNHLDARITFDQLRSKNIGRLVSIRGTVVRVGGVKPIVKSLVFVCEKCEFQQTKHLADGKYAEPESCPAPGCRGRKFTADHDSAKCSDWQRVRLQEISDDAVEEHARTPLFADVEMEATLVDECNPGDVVSVLGVVELLQMEGSGGAMQRQRNAQMHEIYVKAVSVTRKRGTEETGSSQPLSAAAAEAFARGLPDLAAEDAHFGRLGEGWLGVPGFKPEVVETPALTPSEMEFIVRFTEECDGEQFKHLVHSLCPTIYGQEMVKAGMILSLFGGVRKRIGGEGGVPLRGSIHCLVVGDPGMGKSQLLKAAAGVSPRGMYVSGRSVSKAGLTATVVRDPTAGGHTFEAGAMVLSDGGVCCVDEFDKMPNEHTSLLEAMEQQSVSVAKAGLTATLPSRAAVLAAANPAKGQYNRSKSIKENLKMSPALLSRFDLCFILVDTPDDELDDHLSRHVLAPHGKEGNLQLKEAQQKLLAYHAHQDQDDYEEDEMNARKRARENEEDGAFNTSTPSGGAGSSRVSLKRRLRLDLAGADEAFAPLPRGLMRKYIAYAVAYCHPRLTLEAGEVLKAYYLELRSRAETGEDTVPITPRQMESLIRLAEARAKVELRETVTVDDARDAVDLMREAMRDVLSEGGRPGFAAGKKVNKRGKAKMFLDAMRRRAVEKESDYFTTGELFALADDLQLQLTDPEGFLENLNMAGDILKTGRLYKCASSS